MITAFPAHGQQCSGWPQGFDPVAWQKEMTGELKKLRSELLEYRFKTQAERVSQLETSLRQIRAEQLKLQNEQTTHQQSMAQLEAQLSSQTLTPEQRAQLEAERAAFAGAASARSQSRQAGLTRTEAEITESLGVEQKELDSLRARLGQISNTQ